MPLRRLDLRRRLLAAVLTTTAASPAVLAGCAGSGSSTGDTDPATLAPAGSIVYGDLTVNPSGGQRDNAQAVFSRLLNTPDPGTKIADTLDKALKQSAKGVSYGKDIKPWLGRHVGFAVTGLASGGGKPVASFFDSKDDGTARSLIERTNPGANRDYRGVTYRVSGTGVAGSVSGTGTLAVGIVHHVVVDAPEAIFKQVVDTASGGPALASDPAFQRGRTASSSRGQALVNISVNLAPLLNSPALAQSSVQLDAVRRAIDPSQPITFSVDALPNALALEVTAKPSPQAASTNAPPATSLLRALPAQSWLALAVPHVGQSIARALGRLPPQVQPRLTAGLDSIRRKTGLDLQRDVLPALGDTAVFASGTQLAGLAAGSPNPGDVAFGLVSQPTDAAAAKRTIARVGALLRSQGKAAITPAPGGFAARSKANAGGPGILVEQRGDRLAVGIGQRTEDSLLNGSQGPSLGSSPAFNAAQATLGAGLSPSFFLSFAPVLALAQVSSTQSPSYQRAQPYLRKLDYLVLGSGRRDGLAVSRLVLGIVK